MKKSVLISVLLLLTGYGFAQEFKKITLQEAFTLAEQNSKLLQLDSLKIQALDIKKTQSQNAMLPVLGLNSSYTRLSNNIDPFQIPFSGEVFTLNPQILNQFGNRVSIQQPIFQGLKNWNTMKSLDQLKTASALDKQKDQQDIKLNVIQQYYNLYKLQQTLIVLDSNIAQTQVRVNDVSKFKQ